MDNNNSKTSSNRLTIQSSDDEDKPPNHVAQAIMRSHIERTMFCDKIWHIKSQIAHRPAKPRIVFMTVFFLTLHTLKQLQLTLRVVYLFYLNDAQSNLSNLHRALRFNVHDYRINSTWPASFPGPAVIRCT